MTTFLHPRMSRWLALALAVVWVMAVASANVMLTPAMHCHNMPCCPRSDGGMQSCSTAQCAEQVPEKAESQSAAKELDTASMPAALWPAVVAASRSAVPQQELTPGLRYSAAIFRLKDNLRI
ncbi:MAG: hypothetical protein WA399_01415 [Acidobacteriaceae bacterium]